MEKKVLSVEAVCNCYQYVTKNIKEFEIPDKK